MLERILARKPLVWPKEGTTAVLLSSSAAAITHEMTALKAEQRLLSFDSFPQLCAGDAHFTDAPMSWQRNRPRGACICWRRRRHLPRVSRVLVLGFNEAIYEKLNRHWDLRGSAQTRVHTYPCIHTCRRVETTNSIATPHRKQNIARYVARAWSFGPGSKNCSCSEETIRSRPRLPAFCESIQVTPSKQPSPLQFMRHGNNVTSSRSAFLPAPRRSSMVSAMALGTSVGRVDIGGGALSACREWDGPLRGSTGNNDACVVVYSCPCLR